MSGAGGSEVSGAGGSEGSGTGGSEELDSVRQASADLHSQLQEAHKRIEQLVSKSCDYYTN